MQTNKTLFLVGILCLLHGALAAQVVTGVVLGPEKEPIPYASIALEGTTTGVVADVDGRFTLNLPQAGEAVLQIRSLGYQTQMQTIRVAEGQTVNLNISLLAEELYISEAIITSDGRDPAYAIMKAAIARKRQNDDRVKAWSNNAYTKTLIYNNKEKKIEYLSETFSTLWVQKPNQRKEVIKNSRVSGDSKEYSTIGSLFFSVNPYKNTIESQLFDREFVSPMSGSAFLYYDFKLLGSFRDGGKTIYKIKLLPKRKGDPSFDGLLYIVAESYDIQGFDWVINKNRPLKYLDTLRYKQTYVSMRDSLWVPVSAEVTARININVLVERADFNVSALTVYSDYLVTNPKLGPGRAAPKPTPPGRKPKPAIAATKDTTQAKPAPTDSIPHTDPKFFDEILKVETFATENSRDSAYWNSIRPTPLTITEVQDFIKGDSTEKVRKSPAYLDSVNRARNKYSYDKALFGYQRYYGANDNYVSIPGMLSFVQFNAVEGWNFTVAPTWHINDTLKNKYLDVRPAIRYGLANERFSYKLGFTARLDEWRREFVFLDAGFYPSELSPNTAQIDESINSYYALFNKRNYRKQLQQTFVTGAYQRRLGKDFIVRGSASYTRRTPQNNSTGYAVYKRDYLYTPNPEVPEHTTYEGTALINWRPGGKYITLPDGQFSINSGWPQFALSYTYGRQEGPNLQATNFQRIVARVDGTIDFKLMGQARYRARAGYIEKDGGDSLLLPNQFHVQGNETFFNDGEVSRFGNLDYYTYASCSKYVELHYDQNFGGFFLNKLPLVRKLKLHEVAGFHSVAMPGRTPHTELMVGITNIRLFRVNLFQVNYHYVLTGPQSGQTSFTISAGFQP